MEAITQSPLAAAGRPAAQPASASASTTSTATSTSSSADASMKFSASDFMQLLVAEMKNQDPTQPTDPTQYVQQLVGVNSLQQLIQINEGIHGTSTQTS